MGTLLVSLFYGGLLVPALLFFFNHVWHLNRALIARVVAHIQVTVVGTGHWILITVAGYWLVNRLVHGLVDGHHHVFADGGIHLRLAVLDILFLDALTDLLELVG